MQPAELLLVVRGQPDWKYYKRPDARKLPKAPAPELLPRADTANQARRAVEEALDLSDSPVGRIVKTPVEDVLLDREKVAHVTAKFGDHRERFANRIIPTLTEPNEVWMTLYDNGEYRKRYIKVFEGAGKEGRGGLSIVTETPGGGVLYNFIPTRTSGLNRYRNGVLLYPKR